MQNVAAKKIDVLIDLNRLDEAERQARLGLSRQPDDTEMLFRLARIFVARQDYSEALEMAQQALGFSPESEWGFRLASIAARNLGELDDASRYAAEAVRIRPYYSSFSIQGEAYEAAGYLATGEEERKCFASAIDSARAALADNAEHVSSLLILARVSFATGRHDQARSYTRQALEIDPELRYGHSLLGQLAESAGSFEQAVDHYVAAGKLDASNDYPRNRIHAMVLAAEDNILLLKVAGISAIIGLILYSVIGFVYAFGLWLGVCFLVTLVPKYLLWRKLPADLRTFSGSFLFPKDAEGKTHSSVLAGGKTWGRLLGRGLDNERLMQTATIVFGVLLAWYFISLDNDASPNPAEIRSPNRVEDLSPREPSFGPGGSWLPKDPPPAPAPPEWLEPPVSGAYPSFPFPNGEGPLGTLEIPSRDNPSGS